MKENIYFTTYESKIGKLTIASDGKNIIGLWIEGQKYFISTIENKNKMIQKDDLPILLKVRKWLDRYFSGEKPQISELSLKPKGGEFRQLVWKLLCDIPYGEVTTYSEIAKKIIQIKHIKSMSAQAVGGAVGHNPISIIIPCHRVIGANGNLTGYAGGIDKKLELLKLEGADVIK